MFRKKEKNAWEQLRKKFEPSRIGQRQATNAAYQDL